MKRNVSNVDRVVRIVIGILCAYLALFPTPILSNEILRVFIGGFGLINLFTGLFNFCPIYALADISTYNKQEE